MRTTIRAALPCLSLLVLATPAPAQDEAAPATDALLLPADAPRGVLGEDFPENQERQAALLLQNFLAMDLNADFLLSANEWDVWSGWRDLPPPDFTMVDGNSSTFLGFREYEDAATSMGDSRLSDAMHGAVFPEDGAQ